MVTELLFYRLLTFQFTFFQGKCKILFHLLQEISQNFQVLANSFKHVLQSLSP